jgi:tetratricopeptide (TPR) repeat protein
LNLLPKISPRFAIALSLLATTAVYWSGLHGGYLFDDYNNLVDNEQLQVHSLALTDWYRAAMSSPAGGLNRPLAMLTFAANIYWTGLDPFPIKLTNLVIHLLNGILLFGLLTTTFRTYSTSRDEGAPPQNQRDAWLAAIVTATWLLLPINLSAVLYAVQRMESLANLFVLAGLWMYVWLRQRSFVGKSFSIPAAIALISCTALGLLAKETAVLLPAYAFALEYFIFGMRDRAGHIERHVILLFTSILFLPLLAGLIYLLPHYIFGNVFGGRTFTLSQRLLTESRIVVDYIHWTLVPNLDQLSFYHDDFALSYGLLDPPTTMLSIIALAALGACTLLLRRRQPLVSLGLAWFFIAHLLTGTILPLELVFEHRNYFASGGLLLAFFSALESAGIGRWRMVRQTLTIGVLGLAAGTTALRATEWGNPLLFAISEAEKHPLSPRSNYELGREYTILSDYRQDSKFIPLALDQFEKAAKIVGSDIEPDAAILMIVARMHYPKRPDVWQRMTQKLRDRPIGTEDIQAMYSLVACAINHDCPLPENELATAFQTAFSRPDKNAELLTTYANYQMNVTHDYATAIPLLHETIRMNPNNVQYRVNLIEVLHNIGDISEARTELDELHKIQISPLDRPAVEKMENLFGNDGSSTR